jgi:glucose/mannose-6-phosphate isomerase
MKNIDDIKIIEETDHSKMRDVIAGLPAQCRDAFGLGRGFSVPEDYRDVKNIVFCGIGGSAIGGEIISCYLRKKAKMPMYVNRSYSLPGFVGRETLALILSYSGNTEETVSAYHQAVEKGAKIAVLTSGGQLAELAKQAGLPYLLIPGGLPPRGALGLGFFPVLALLSGMGLIENQEKQVEEAVCLLEKMEKDLGTAVQGDANPAKELARRIFNDFCAIYAGEPMGCIATRWRGQFAENSKALSSSHVLPEMNHNEIVGWAHPRELLKSFTAVILRDKGNHPQVQKRMEITKEILQKDGIKIEEVWSKGEGLLARMFSLIYMGDFVSLYLAILNGEDPTPVKRIEYLKKRLREQ